MSPPPPGESRTPQPAPTANRADRTVKVRDRAGHLLPPVRLAVAEQWERQYLAIRKRPYSRYEYFQLCPPECTGDEAPNRLYELNAGSRTTCRIRNEAGTIISPPLIRQHRKDHSCDEGP